MTYKLSKTSLSRMKGIHPDLRKLIKRAILISTVDFLVVQGLRTKEQQRENIAKGVSWTIRSRHLTGHAVDLAPWVNGKIDWNDTAAFSATGQAVVAAARQLDIPIVWGALRKYGGDWSRQNDMGHIELQRKEYPA